MPYYWLLITIWFGRASLQQIDNIPPLSQETLPTDLLSQSLPYFNYYNLPSGANDFEAYQRERDQATSGTHLDFGINSDNIPYLHRLRRTVKNQDEWAPNLIDTDKTTYLHALDPTQFLTETYGLLEDNKTELVNNIDKRNFSPWGGKRSDPPSFENMWTWKRAVGAREPSMPKRVRFSPWGGKRSGQIIMKPNLESSKLFLATLPELTRIVSNYYPKDNNYNLAGYQFVPSTMKGHPINILTLSTKMKDGAPRESIPFKKFLEYLPQLFKPGHPYQAVNLKKDGKRKVKFSAWGGKRSPPIIGPIWTPAAESVKEPTLNALLFFRNSKPITKAQ